MYREIIEMDREIIEMDREIIIMDREIIEMDREIIIMAREIVEKNNIIMYMIKYKQFSYTDNKSINRPYKQFSKKCINAPSIIRTT